jgi:hypothetical protein
MARVPKTSGQGVSRKAYQTAYRLGARGSASPGAGDSPRLRGEAKAETAGGGTRGRPKGKIDSAAGMNISYGDILPIGDLEDIENYAKQKPAKPSVSLKTERQKRGKK